jgi:exodeoxyribonuclease VII large subunit
VAEIGDIKVIASGHCFIELVERANDSEIPTAKCNAVVWRNMWGIISGAFVSATGKSLERGMKILVSVTATFHQTYGFSLQITDIDPMYTVGDMERRRRESIKRLVKERLLDMNGKLPVPNVVQRIAVISSAGAAGYRDFCNELAISPYRFEITLFEAVMQGSESEGSIITALHAIAEAADMFDAVAIIRGGGATGDLASFDGYLLCSHIARFPLPVMTGIGHDEDVSVADMVASVSLKTPTAVAGWLVDKAAAIDAELERLAALLGHGVERILETQKSLLARLSLTLSKALSELTRGVELHLERIVSELSHHVHIAIENRGIAFERAKERLETTSSEVITRHKLRLEAAEREVKGRNPKNILALGFAFVRHNGRPVSSVGQVGEGERLEVSLRDGIIETNIEKIWKN